MRTTARKKWGMGYVAGLLVLCLFLVRLGKLHGEELMDVESASTFSNVGFMENPSKELKNKFSMCDAFLNVEWIDKTKKIGYSHYDAVIEGKKKSIWALVNLDDLMPSYTLDIYQFKRQNKMKELFDLVKNGKPKWNFDTFFIDGEGFYEVNYGDVLLSDNRQTVCIAYPDGLRAWIIEGKTVNHAFSESQESELVTKLNALKLSRFTPEYAAKLHVNEFDTLSEETVSQLWVLDINHDDKPDLVYIAYAKDLIIYSIGNTYYRMARQDFPVGSTVWSFPQQSRTCSIKPYGHKSYMTTDGKNYFLNNQCNLTQLALPSIQE